MGDISPVLQAFLAGQGGQNDLLRTAQSIVNQRNENTARTEAAKARQQEIANQLKHFDAMSKQADAHHELETEIFNLHRKQAHMAAVNDIRDKLRTGEIPLQGTNFSMPGMKHVQVGGEETQDPSTNRFQANPTQQVDTGDAGFGMINVPTPKTNIQSAQEQQAAMMPGILDLFTKEHKITAADDLTKVKESAQLRSELAKDMQNMKDEMTRQGLDSKMQIANLHSQLAISNEMARLFGPGVTTPAEGASIIRDTAIQRGLGKIDNGQIPNHLLPAVNTYSTKNGIISPNGGTKFRAELTDAAGGAARLLNDFDELDKKYPAGGNLAGRMVDKVKSTSIPFVGPVTDIGQDFKAYGSNIAAYASVTGETPGMMRSPVLAQKAEAAAPLPGDTPEVRNAKRIKTLDLTFAKVQRKVGGLSQEQRVEFWRDAFNEMPNLKSDYKLKDVLENILKTGTYDPSKLNGLK